MGLKQKVIRALAIRAAKNWIKDAIAGKKGDGVKDFLKKPGVPSGIVFVLILLVSLAGGLFGFDPTAALAVINTVSTGVGVSPSEVTKEVGVDPATLAGYLLLVITGIRSFYGWWKSRQQEPTK